jgi:FXSXX-COOH protein
MAEGPEYSGEMGLLDLADVSLDDLSLLDDSVVANAIRELVARRSGRAEFRMRFSNFESHV